MADTESEIIYPINAPIFSKTFKTISLPITEGFGFKQVLSIIQTYPVIIPRLGQYARLEIKSENVDQLYSELRQLDSSVIISRMYNFNKTTRFVSWGGLRAFKLPEWLYSMYLEALGIFLSLNRPIFLRRPDSYNGFIIKSERFSHAVNNSYFGNTERAIVSLSSICVKFSKMSLNASEFLIKKDSSPLMSVNAEVGFFVNDEIIFKDIRLAITPAMLEFIKKNGLGVYACYIYSVNDWKVGLRQKPELNLVIHLREIFYSPDSLFPFYGNINHATSFSYGIILAESMVTSELAKLKHYTEYAHKNIQRLSPLYEMNHKSSKFIFHVLKPWVVFSLITAYCFDPGSRETVAYILTSDNSNQRIAELLNNRSKFLPSGSYIGLSAQKILNEISNAKIDKDI